MELVTATDISIRRPLSETEIEVCARLMIASQPWIALGRTYKAALALLQERSREQYVAVYQSELVGFLILSLSGAFVGYIQTVCIAPEFRGRGIGTFLIRFAEERIFRESPNVFICVSSFNHSAQRLYTRLGYSIVGELKDYIVLGHSELLLRKSIGPIQSFQQLVTEVNPS